MSTAGAVSDHGLPELNRIACFFSMSTVYHCRENNNLTGAINRWRIVKRNGISCNLLVLIDQTRQKTSCKI